MTIARTELVDQETPGLYHCISRCVRRAFLCGVDDYSGQDFGHRREWVRGRLEKLARAFAIEVFAYAVMSNHAHEVLRNRPDLSSGWSAEEVAHRWLAVFPRQDPATGRPPDEPEERDVLAILNQPGRVETLRARLSDISWFMRALNESLARRANREDGCKGRFWEGRFKCQRLLDEASVLACMCYVDLNPVRARIAASLEDSEFTSAYDRIVARRAGERRAALAADAQPGAQPAPDLRETAQGLDADTRRADWLARLDGAGSPFQALGEADYLRILDWTGRQLRADKPGAIDPDVLPLLESLELDAAQWIATVRRYRSLFWLVAGRAERIRDFAAKLGRRWLKGCLASRAAFAPPAAPHQR